MVQNRIRCCHQRGAGISALSSYASIIFVHPMLSPLSIEGTKQKKRQTRVHGTSCRQCSECGTQVDHWGSPILSGTWRHAFYKSYKKTYFPISIATYRYTALHDRTPMAYTWYHMIPYKSVPGARHMLHTSSYDTINTLVPYMPCMYVRSCPVCWHLIYFTALIMLRLFLVFVVSVCDLIICMSPGWRIRTGGDWVYCWCRWVERTVYYEDNTHGHVMHTRYMLCHIHGMYLWSYMTMLWCDPGKLGICVCIQTTCPRDFICIHTENRNSM